MIVARGTREEVGLLAKKWIPAVARLIASNRYEDAAREAEAGIEQIAVEIDALTSQQQELRDLQRAAKTIAQHVEVQARPSPKPGGRPRLPSEEIITAADGLLVNGKATISAEEVRDELARRGIDPSVVRHPTSVISTVLSRNRRFQKVGTGEFRRAISVGVSP